MQQVLNNEEFDRWQRLLLQRTLDSMEGKYFVYLSYSMIYT